jgi:hypothetical protein
MNTMLILADSAQVSSGKLYILGGGWSITGPGPTPSAVALQITVESHEFGDTHHWELSLEDADGHLVLIEGPNGDSPIEVRGDFTANTPEGVPAGTPVMIPLAINFGPIPLAEGSRFVWRLSIDGETPPGGLASFTTRSGE